MGSLILAGAVQGFGKGMVANAEADRRTEERDLDKQHDVALQRMRDTAASTRQEDQQTFQTEAHETVRSENLLDQGTAATAATAAATTERQFTGEQNEADRENKIFLEAMKQYTKSTEGSNKVKSIDGKWEMKVLTQTIAPDGGIPYEQDTFVVREPGSPLTLIQKDIFMVPTGKTEEEIEKTLAIAKSGRYKEAEQDLISKAGTKADDSSDFLENFGYLPVAYYRKLNTQARGSNEGFQSFFKTFRKPANVAPAATSTTPLPVIDNTADLKPGGEDSLALQYEKLFGQSMPDDLTEEQRTQLENFIQEKKSGGFLSQGQLASD